MGEGRHRERRRGAWYGDERERDKARKRKGWRGGFTASDGGFSGPGVGDLGAGTFFAGPSDGTNGDCEAWKQMLQRREGVKTLRRRRKRDNKQAGKIARRLSDGSAARWKLAGPDRLAGPKENS